MNCLRGYIGLQDLTENPGSGLFVNSLPGMSTELVDGIANSEQSNYVKVWDDVETIAFERIKTDVRNLLSSNCNFQEILYKTKRPQVYRNRTSLDPSGNYRGVFVQVPEGEFLELSLTEVYIYSASVATTVLKVVDINDGKELHSQSIDLVQGLNTIPVGEIFALNFGAINLFIGVDATFESISFLPEYYDFHNCNNNCHSFGSFNGQPHDLQIDPVEATVFDFDGLTKFSDGRGISIGAEIRFSVETFICQNREKLKSSLLYLIGSGLLFAKIGAQNNPRLNFFTASEGKQTNALRLDYETTYLNFLNGVLGSIPMDYGDVPPAISYKYNDV